MVSVWMLLGAALALPFSQTELGSLCAVDGRAYTGFRVLHDRALRGGGAGQGARGLHSAGVAIVECDNGRQVFGAVVPPGESVFNRSIAVPGHDRTLRITRRAPYRGIAKLRYVPGTIVGTVFAVDGRGACTPQSPLVADGWARWHLNKTDSGFSDVHVYTSLLRTPDVLDRTYPRSDQWKQGVSCYE